MPIKILEIHHSAVRIKPDPENIARDHDFYTRVLGLKTDPARPDFEDLPGYWLNIGEQAQFHLMAYEGEHPYARGTGNDPSRAHVAFGVEDIAETEAELKRMEVPYWTLGVLGGPEKTQIFLFDHSNNLIELHQFDTCRCTLRNRVAAS